MYRLAAPLLYCEVTLSRDNADGFYFGLGYPFDKVERMKRKGRETGGGLAEHKPQVTRGTRVVAAGEGMSPKLQSRS
jgi:hypothetical protein